MVSANRMWRILRASIVSAATILFLVVIAAAAVLQLSRMPAGRKWLRDRLVAQIQQTLPGFDLQRLSGDYTHRLRLIGISLRDRHDTPVLAVERIDVSYDPWSILSARLLITRLDVYRPAFQLRPTKGGASNLDALLAESISHSANEPPPQPERFSAVLELRRLRIIDGSFSQGAARRGAPLLLRRLNLAASAILRGGNSLSLRVQALSAQLRLPGEPSELSLAAGAKAELGAGGIDGQLSLAVGGLRGLKRAMIRLRVKGPPRGISLGLEADLAKAGRLSLRGRTAWQQGRLNKYSLSLSTAALELNQLVSKLQIGPINLSLEARGQGVPWAPGSTARWALRADNSIFAGVKVPVARAQGRLLGRELRLDRLELRAAGVTVSGRAALRQLRSPQDPAALQARLHARATDLSELGRLLAASLGGVAKAQLFVDGHLNQLAGRVEASGKNLRIAGAQLGSVQLAAKLRKATQARVNLRIEDLRIPDSNLKVRSATVLAQGSTRYGRLDAHIDGRSVHGALAARFARDEGGLRATFERAGLRWGARRIALRLPAVISWSADRRLSVPELQLAFLGGEVRASGHFDLRGPRGRLRLQARRLRVAGQRVGASIDAQVATQLGLNARLWANPSKASLHLQATGKLQRRGSSLALARNGPLALRLVLRRMEAAWLRRTWPTFDFAGKIEAEVQLAGSLRHPELALQASLQEGRWATSRGFAADLSLNATSEMRFDFQLRQKARVIVRGEGELGAGLGQLLALDSLAAALAADPAITLSLELPSLSLAQAFEAFPEWKPPSAISGSLAAELSATGSLSRPALVSKVVLRELQLGRQKPLAALTAQLQAHSMGSQTVAEASLRLDQQSPIQLQASIRRSVAQLALHGLSSGEVVSAGLQAPRLDLSRLGGFLPGQPRLTGILQASASLSGPLTNLRTAAKLRLSRAGLHGVTLGDLRADLAVQADRHAKLTLRMDQPLGGRLAAKLGYRLQPQRIDGQLTAAAVDLRPLRHFVPGVQALEGRLTGRLGLAGRLRSPDLHGELRLVKGRLRPDAMSALEDIEVELALKPDRLHLRRLRLRSGDGGFSAEGRVGLSGLTPTEFVLTARGRRFAIDTDAIKGAYFDGGIRLAGRYAKRRVSAKVTLKPAVLHAPAVKSQPKLLETGPLPDVLLAGDSQRRSTGSKPHPAKRTARPLGYDVLVRVDPLFVRGEELDVEASVNLRAFSGRSGMTRLRGVLSVRHGTVKVMGNAFDVRKAAVRFSGQRTPDPALDILIQRDLGDATVFVSLQGTLSHPELELRSEPPIYDRAQIVSWLVTGRIDPRSGDDSGDQSLQLAAAVSQALIGGIARRLAPKVGIDVARVNLGQKRDERTGESSIHAEAELGKYLTRRLYLAYRRIFGASSGENANEAALEYRVSARWLLTAIFGDAGVGGLDMMWSYTY